MTGKRRRKMRRVFGQKNAGGIPPISNPGVEGVDTLRTGLSGC
jgi:hypothetical protein